MCGGRAPTTSVATLFRDWLRHSEQDRSRYEAVKRALAGRYWTDVNDYADAETEVVAAITARAEEWAAATGWGAVR